MALHAGNVQSWLNSSDLFSHPLVMGLVYLVLATIFFLLARTRYNYAR
jgi:hypothetical protein